MSKLYDLLYAMIDRLNKSVKTNAQTLTEAEKTQARANIGAMASTFAPTAESVGADPKGTAAAAVSAHNTNAAAHADIRSLISGLADRLNALANSDDTTLDQMKEVVDYIKDNRELIESVTTNKVNVADIVDNLATADAKKPLSAKQGVELLNLINSSSGSGGGSGVNLDSAEVGQLIVVESVDADGKPVKWKAVDRTHYKETIGEDVAVLAETSVRFTNSTATVSGFVAGAIKEGQTYTVNWNGTEYPCKAYLDDGIVHLGNSALAGGSVTTSDPFCIVGAGATCMVFKNTENTETITLKVDGVAEVVYHKLPAQYLPDALQFGDMEVELLPETELTFVENPDMGGMMIAMITPTTTPVEGNTYSVSFAGVTYECTASLQGGESYYLGNNIMLGGADSGEPFGIMIMIDADGAIAMAVAISLFGVTNATVGIKGVQPVPISPEYAPEPITLDVVSLGLGEVNNSSSVSLYFDAGTYARTNLENQLRTAAKSGTIKVKFNYSVTHTNMFDPNSITTGQLGGSVTLPMSIFDGGSGYCMVALFQDNIVYFEYFGGSLEAICRRLTLATET